MSTNPSPVECKNESSVSEQGLALVKYVILGILFGITFVKAEIISWFRIQEMFHFQSFHMYGVIGSAVAVGLISMQLIKRFHIKTLSGEEVRITPKKYNKGTVIGSIFFGFGWAITGACPGPIYAQIGAGFLVSLITLLGAIGGTFVYGVLKDKLPH
ncbi:MAG: putative inner rane protein [Chitinophagaceae bacterium]|nr:putative inner rane protein [Chitinophagaceae bacterium]